MKDLFKAVENCYIIVESALDKTYEFYQLKSDELVIFVNKVWKQNQEQCYTNEKLLENFKVEKVKLITKCYRYHKKNLDLRNY